MIITLERLILAQLALDWLSTVSDEDHLDATTKYNVSYLLGAMEPYLRAYEKARLAAVKRLGEVGENGLEVPRRNLAEFGEEMLALMQNTECDLPDTVIPAEPLVKVINAAQLHQLDWLLDIDQAQPETNEGDKKSKGGSQK